MGWLETRPDLLDRYRHEFGEYSRVLAKSANAGRLIRAHKTLCDQHQAAEIIEEIADSSGWLMPAITFADDEPKGRTLPPELSSDPARFEIRFPTDDRLLRVGLVLHEAAHWLQLDRWLDPEHWKLYGAEGLTGSGMNRIINRVDLHGASFVKVLDLLVAEWTPTDKRIEPLKPG